MWREHDSDEFFGEIEYDAQRDSNPGTIASQTEQKIRV